MAQVDESKKASHLWSQFEGNISSTSLFQADPCKRLMDLMSVYFYSFCLMSCSFHCILAVLARRTVQHFGQRQSFLNVLYK